MSGLRTTFITTVWEDDAGALQHYVQGKAILMSYRNGGNTHRGTGFWGVRKNCLPVINNIEALPDWLRRPIASPSDTGTTLSIVGFVPPKSWQSILAASIAESFFGAISRGHLEVEIDGGPTLTAASLPGIFADSHILDAVSEEKDEPETFISGGHFLHALTSTESKIEETENAGLGRCRLHILVGENLPKKVAILRNGMLITSELERLRRFGEFKEFVAVLECLSDKGNSLLRAMEPPAHNDFEPARLPTSSERRVAKIALRELAEWVREMLRRHAQDPVAEVTEIDELAEFFGDEDDETGADGRDGDENPRGIIKIRARPLPKKKPTAAAAESGSAYDGEGEGADGADGDGDEGEETGDGTEGEGTGAGGTGGRSNDSDGGDESSGGGGGGGGGRASAVTLGLRNVRAVVTATDGRRVAFTPDVTGEIRVELEDSGADTNRLLRVVKASSGTVLDGRIKLNCLAGQRVLVDVQLDRAFEGTVRVKANAV